MRTRGIGWRPSAARRALIGVAVLAATVLTAGCVPESTVADQSTPAPTATAVTVTRVIDGDTIATSEGTVRLIGIDAPERRACGYDDASAVIEDVLTAGDPIDLDLPAGQNDRDRHGRMLRFVEAPGGIDVGLRQLEAGNAVARYDSTDGYPAHPREAEYHAAQRATRGADGTVVTVACAAASAPAEPAASPPASATPDSAAPAPPAPPPDAGEDAWWRHYPSCTKLKKNTVGDPVGPFHRDDPAEAGIYAWFAHGTGNAGDGDGDGRACE